MKLSFVIPTRNEENYIGQCLTSLLKAIGGRKDIEIIVVDNGSTDKTKEVVAKFPTVKLLLEPIPGTSRTRETGFRASRGELVGFIDADTILPPNWIPTAEHEFAKNKKMVCLSGPYLYYDLPGGINFLVKIFYLISYGVYVLTRFIFRAASVVTGGNYVVRREALEAIGGHNVNITFYGDDTDVALRMSKVGQVKFSFGFPVYSSGRRFMAEGLVTTAIHYALNYFWIVLFGKPFNPTPQTTTLQQANAGKKGSLAVKKRDWVFGFLALLILLAVTGGVIFGIYHLAESGVISTITWIQIETAAKDGAEKLKNNLNEIASSTQNVLQEKIHAYGQ